MDNTRGATSRTRANCCSGTHEFTPIVIFSTLLNKDFIVNIYANGLGPSFHNTCSIFSFLCGVSLTIVLTCCVNCIVCSSINILLLPFPCLQTFPNAIRYITKYIYQCINRCIHYTQYTTQQLHYAFNSLKTPNSIGQNVIDWI